MKKSELTRQKIIDVTTTMIEQAGNLNQITIRKIAEEAGVGVGLVNHYFTSKDELIQVCVQNIIHQVVYQFKLPQKEVANNDIAYTTQVAILVMDFLMEHPQISRISILGDYENPQEMDNSEGTILGLASCMSQGHPNQKHLQKAFLLVSAMQSAFLKREMLKKRLSIDIEDKKQRDQYMRELVQTIFGEDF